MKNFREIITKKFNNGEKPGKIFKDLKKLGVKRDFVYRTIRRYKETGSSKDRQRSGRPRSVRTKKVMKAVRERIRRKGQRSARKLAKELNISRGSMLNILKEDLGMNAYKKRKVQGLSEASKEKRRKRVCDILAWHAEDEFVYSDEKLFVLEQCHNPQNDRIWAASIKNIPEKYKNVQRYQNAMSVMVWGAFSKRGKLPLVFIDKGVKINANYYKTEVLEKVLLPNMQSMYGDDYYCYQQDGAPSHTSNAVQTWCSDNLADFLNKNEWPPSSPDLNPLDFFAWSYMLSQLNSYKFTNIDDFKRVIQKIWEKMPMDAVRAACNAFEKRLRLVKKFRGGIIPKYLL
jgi:transposase